MKKISLIALCASLSAAMMLAGCSSSANADVKVQDASYYEKFKDKNIEINVYNWGEYISDGSDDSLDINKAFEKISGIKVNYTQYATNEELRAKLKSGAVSYD
ncbi:MAG TPA: spermidine/putrescine ABC transporter substrate-binding protein, partial [Ruminococcaceae bacterium]|nr:spermidine/putrescine ABC transporter substrate-binding protein [Oscillospiraceae bacterium]